MEIEVELTLFLSKKVKLFAEVNCDLLHLAVMQDLIGDSHSSTSKATMMSCRALLNGWCSSFLEGGSASSPRSQTTTFGNLQKSAFIFKNSQYNTHIVFLLFCGGFFFGPVLLRARAI
jgi:hypothetical protein